MTLTIPRPLVTAPPAKAPGPAAAHGVRDGVEQPAPASGRRRRAEAPIPVDVVDQWGIHSFPASDPPANW